MVVRAAVAMEVAERVAAARAEEAMVAAAMAGVARAVAAAAEAATVAVAMAAVATAVAATAVVDWVVADKPRRDSRSPQRTSLHCTAVPCPRCGPNAS